MKHTGLTKAQYAAALAREQAARRTKTCDILAALAADCAGETLRPDDVTIARVRAAMPAGVARADSTIRRTLNRQVAADKLMLILHCYDPATSRYVTAYRAPLPTRPMKHPQMMHCPKCKAHVPRSPAVCPACGADTRRRKP